MPSQKMQKTLPYSTSILSKYQGARKCAEGSEKRGDGKRGYIHPTFIYRNITVKLINVCD